MMFAAAVGHRSGRATPSLRGAPQRQSMEIVRRETIYRNRNAVQTNPATSVFIITDAMLSGVRKTIERLNISISTA
jgi:predicted phosphoribosyltransferase